MKIQKIIFSCSEAYSPFWNIQSKLWNSMGVEPVCLLYSGPDDWNRAGSISKTDMSEDFGHVIEMSTIAGKTASGNGCEDPSNNIPWNVQMNWSKFNHAASEPDVTWITGDIDLIPLQKAHFTTQLDNVPDTAYVHLNAGGISGPRLGIREGFSVYGSQRRGLDTGAPGADLPAHYHVAKGRMFERYTKNLPFEDQVKILMNGRYGLGPVGGSVPEDQRISNAYWYYWCAEENYTSYVLEGDIRRGSVDFRPFYYSTSNDTERIDRDTLDGNNYVYTPHHVSHGRIVDVHCHRPYSVQERSLMELIRLSGLLQ